MKQLQRTSIEELIPAPFRPQANRWLNRGDGIAVYQNQHEEHPEFGRLQLVSFGSTDAQFPTSTPPVQMPDLGDEHNWRYRLIGTYRGELL